MSIETPQYKILKKDKAFEVRKYNGYITANVKIKGSSYNQAVNSGFSYLADYIFGNNRRSDKIAMTVPVRAEKLGHQKIAMTAPVNATSDGDSYLVSFTMPSKYQINDLPIPNNKDVFIIEIKPYYAVAIKFSGYLTEKKLELYGQKLKDWAKENKLKTIGPPVSSQFDPPWQPWFLRRNEVYLEVGKFDG